MRGDAPLLAGRTRSRPILMTGLGTTAKTPCTRLVIPAGYLLAERRRNVSGAFRATARVSDTVLLVDDVYTSGSTVSAAAQALRAAGAARVDVATFARTIRLTRAT